MPAAWKEHWKKQMQNACPMASQCGFSLHWFSLHWWMRVWESLVQIAMGFLDGYCYSRVNQLAHWRHAGLVWILFFPCTRHDYVRSFKPGLRAAKQCKASSPDTMRCCTLFQLKNKKINCKYCHCQVQNPSPSPVQNRWFSLSLYIYTFGLIFIILFQHPWRKMINKVGCGICSWWSKLCISHLSYKIPSQSCVFQPLKKLHAASGFALPPPLLDGKITRAQPKPKILDFPRLPALFPLPLFCWRCGAVRLNVFFS